MRRLIFTILLIVSPYVLTAQIGNCVDSTNQKYFELTDYNDRLNYLDSVYKDWKPIGDCLWELVSDMASYTGIHASVSLGTFGAFYRTDEIFYSDLAKWRAKIVEK